MDRIRHIARSITKKILANGATPSSGFTGKGKLTEYKDKDDSWILNQMKTQKVDPGIKRTREKGQIKIKNTDKKKLIE